MKLLKKSDLTEDQQGALAAIKKFLESDDREFVLCGAAGTGKTSLVNVLLAELDHLSFYEYICTATTNKAVEVISRNTGREYDRTIYSLEGLTLKDEDDKGPMLVREPGSESKLKNYDLVIIDEASMVSMQLLQEIEFDLIEHSRVKVLYIGDRCQLPPVEDAKAGMLESLVFSLPNKYELTKVMRTALDNPVLRLATQVRGALDYEGDIYEHETSVNENGDGVTFYHLRRDFMAAMYTYFCSDEYKEDTDYAVAVAWTNNAVDAINRVVRKKVYPDTTDAYVEGEELRVKTPFRRQVPGKKGVFYPVYTMEERLKVHSVEECEDPNYALKCWKLVVENFRALPKNRTEMTVYVVKKEAKNDYERLLSEVALECKARAREPGYQGKGHKYTTKEAWEPYGNLRRFYLDVDYIYAMTTHKAQGSTIQNVFVVQRDMDHNPNTIERNKLKYTAFTRASKQLHILVGQD